METGGESASVGTRDGVVFANMVTGLVQALGGGVGLQSWIFTRLHEAVGGGKDGGSVVFAVVDGR